jgi:sugar/nucleoside kinase (ribokinase family)
VSGKPDDIICIGHAIVDVLCPNDDAFLSQHGLTKGSMELVEEDRAEPLYNAMVGVAHKTGHGLLEISGGSGANTAVVAASLGASSGFVGKVRDDSLGSVFAHDLQAAGVLYQTSHAADGPSTARCLVNVSPDAERTMCTYLGAARGIREPDIHDDWFRGAAVSYLEGYLWDEPRARRALEKAMRTVHEGGKRFSLTLSDTFLVDRFRAEFHELLHAKAIDILFANEHELCSLFETSDFDHAVTLVRGHVEVTAVTRGAQGSVVVTADAVEAVGAAPVAHVVDTTGAGDAYAGGFLYAFTKGLPLRRCAEIAGQAASDVISHLGARPSAGLRDRLGL